MNKSERADGFQMDALFIIKHFEKKYLSMAINKSLKSQYANLALVEWYSKEENFWAIIAPLKKKNKRKQNKQTYMATQQ